MDIWNLARYHRENTLRARLPIGLMYRETDQHIVRRFRCMKKDHVCDMDDSLGHRAMDTAQTGESVKMLFIGGKH